MMRRPKARHRTIWLPLLAAIAAMCAATQTLADDDSENRSEADTTEVTLPVPESIDVALDQSVSLVAGFYYPSEFCPEPRFGADLEIPDVASLYTPGVIPFWTDDREPQSLTQASLAQTDNFIDRLAELEKLEILPLLRTNSASVYFGINRDGRVGMHINSRDNSRN